MSDKPSQAERAFEAVEKKILKELLPGEPHPAVRAVVLRKLAELRGRLHAGTRVTVQMSIDEDPGMLSSAAAVLFTQWRFEAYAMTTRLAEAEFDGAAASMRRQIELLTGPAFVNGFDRRAMAIILHDALSEILGPLVTATRDKLEHVVEDEDADDYARDVCAQLLKNGEKAKAFFQMIMEMSDEELLEKIAHDEESNPCFRHTAKLRLSFVQGLKMNRQRLGSAGAQKSA
jgi:hypothetical protein